MHMKGSRKAFVLGGGGARGALQAGALHALLEAGVQPDLVVGTSAGAINGAYLAIRGFTSDSLVGLESAWHDAASAGLLPANYLWLTVRMLFNRAGSDAGHSIRHFLVDHGLSPHLRFGQLEGPRFICVAADLRTGEPVLYGTDPDHSVLNAVLASTALPPWVRPFVQDDCLLMDGGLVSNLPIEPALTQGATEIVALDLADPRLLGPAVGGIGPFLFQLRNTMEQRQIYLEKQLAAAHHVPVHQITLWPESPVPVWDFGRPAALIESGFVLTQSYLAEHPELTRLARPSGSPGWRVLSRLLRLGV
jgi:NTE family protein